MWADQMKVCKTVDLVVNLVSIHQLDQHILTVYAFVLN